MVGSIQPQADLYTFSNLFAPRLGYVFDLAGNGKTVVKANYGFFWHNPGVTISQNANPNIASKSMTFTWNDQAACAGCIAGDKRWQSGEESALPTAQALSGAIKLNPDIKSPHSHEASIFVEHQLNQTMGMRVGYVFKTEDDLITTNYQLERGLSAYTVPSVFLDLGLNGVRDTAAGSAVASGDDRFIPIMGLPTANAAQFPTTQYVTNLDEFGRYKTLEFETNKRFANRWSATLGGSYTWMFNFPNNFPQTPNQPGAEDRSTWNFKATGSYEAPKGVRISPVFRHQSGVNFARTATINCAAPCSGLTVAGSSTTIFVEPSNSNREDNIYVFDVRVEKTMNLVGSLRLRGMFDLFNIGNSHASETIGRATGISYLKPTLILAPRTARLGFRLMW